MLRLDVGVRGLNRNPLLSRQLVPREQPESGVRQLVVDDDVVTRLFARWRSVREPRAFAYVVGTNLCRHHWKQSSRERAAVATLGAELPTGRPAHDPWLQDLVQRLPVRLREVVLLHYYADLPIEQVAAAIHRPVGTVKRRLHEARAALAAAVSESEEVPA